MHFSRLVVVPPSCVLLLALSGFAHAQVPGVTASPGAQMPGTAAPAGAVPSLQQQPSGEIRQDSSDPTRAPGSKADGGAAMPRAGDNSGTTTFYADTVPEKPIPWPCAQQKVPSISGGTIWSGPDLSQGKDWDQDNDVAALAQKLASRRLPLNDADPLIADFVKQAGAGKDKKLTQLFVGTLEIINTSRGEILQGIMRYARGQERLAERMRTESDKISEAQEDVQGPTGIAANEVNRDFAWDQRIFKERKQALSYVCETPSLLERRAYEIGKRIQAQLSTAKG